MAITWYAGSNANSLQIISPINQITGEPIEIATVEATITDKDTGAEIGGITQPITLTKVTGLPKFAVALPKEAADLLTDGQVLRAVVTFLGYGDNEDAEVEDEITVIEPRTA